MTIYLLLMYTHVCIYACMYIYMYIYLEKTDQPSDIYNKKHIEFEYDLENKASLKLNFFFSHLKSLRKLHIIFIDKNMDLHMLYNKYSLESIYTNVLYVYIRIYTHICSYISMQLLLLTSYYFILLYTLLGSISNTYSCLYL